MYNVCAVVITYNPSENLEENIAAISEQVIQVIIIDNASSQDGALIISKLKNRFGDKLMIILNKTNLGISGGLNKGINIALENCFEWVVTLDQDSKFSSPTSINSMISAASLLREKYMIGMITPTYLYEHTDYKKNKTAKILEFNNVKYTNKKTSITSGNLIPLKIFNEVGMYDDKLFIDYVDFEFCLRLSRLNYKIVALHDVYLIHSVGHTIELNLFIFKFKTSLHNVERLYYRYRNRFYIYKYYFLYSPTWCFLDFLTILREISKIILFYPNRIEYLKNISKGIIDGLQLK